MNKVLILGGTKFFGKRLAEKLEELGADLTIATRGNSDVSFLKNAKHVKVDRSDKDSMERAFAESSWDVIYDQICFTPEQAEYAVEVFAGKTKRYIFTSTLSVYEMNEQAEKNETAFDPYTYQVNYEKNEKLNYGEGKRRAEAVFFQKADFPVAAVRPPIVLGEDDYTERLHDHVRRVMNGSEIGIDDLQIKLSFVDSDDLAGFLLWSGDQDFTGPINASSPDQITLAELIDTVEKAAGKKAKITKGDKGTASPMNFPVSFYQNTERAANLGYHFRPLSAWFQPLVELLAEKEK